VLCQGKTNSKTKQGQEAGKDTERKGTKSHLRGSSAPKSKNIGAGEMVEAKEWFKEAAEFVGEPKACESEGQGPDTRGEPTCK